MRKSDIAVQVAGRTALTKAQAKSAVNAAFEVIRDVLANVDTVSVTGFGQVLDEEPVGADGREHRRRGVEGSVVQGQESASRRVALVSRGHSPRP